MRAVIFLLTLSGLVFTVSAAGQDLKSGMRWKFVNSPSKAFQKDRARTIRKIDAWWKAFEKRRPDLAAFFESKRPFDIPRWMRRTLGAVDDRIMWEFGRGSKGGYRLVISPETDRHLRPLVETILERAPKAEGWTFYAYRPPEGLDVAENMLKARGFAPVSDSRVTVSRGKHNLVDLTFHSPRCTGPDDRDALNTGHVAARVLLGEKTLDVWIGEISVEKAGEHVSGSVGIRKLSEAVRAEVAVIGETLPKRPAWQFGEDAEWTVFEAKPEKRREYPCRTDIVVATSMAPKMLAAAHADCVFYSERFSRFGELYCYIKMDGVSGLSASKFNDRSEIQDALRKALLSAKCGTVVGGGTGLRYSYVDLALTDATKGIEQVIRVLREGKIMKRTWILFFDDIYEYEWVGIWNDTPPPPGMKAR